MNTVTQSALYQKIITTPKQISWKDIFGDSSRKRSQQDTDFAIIAGTTLDTVNSEVGMLQKWQKPWLYRRVLIAGLILSAVTLGAVAMVFLLVGYCAFPALNLLMIMIPPCVVPVTLMVFFWEMNAPRDISLVQMIGYFFTGGILSIMLTVLLNIVLPGAIVAAITEEPAKLIISVFFLRRIYKKRGTVYGFTGLAVGAAVGAGFGAFESAQYAYNCLPMVDADGLTVPVMLITFSSLIPVLVNIIIRSIFALCGHVLYCAPYACIAALNMEKNGKALSSIKSPAFWGVFAISFFCHVFWNILAGWLTAAVFIVLLWSTTLYGIRRSFVQLVKRINTRSAAGNMTTQLKIQGTRGVHTGIAYVFARNEILIGTDASCHLTYPVNLVEISKTHCKLLIQNGSVYLSDLGSQSGTYLNGVKLQPMTTHPLKRGDRFAVGSRDQEFAVI